MTKMQMLRDLESSLEDWLGERHYDLGGANDDDEQDRYLMDIAKAKLAFQWLHEIVADFEEEK